MNTMTNRQYRTALRLLGLDRYSHRELAPILGVSKSTVTRLAAGTQDVPDTLALLLGQYLEHGLPDTVESGADLTSS